MVSNKLAVQKNPNVNPAKVLKEKFLKHLDHQ